MKSIATVLVAVLLVIAATGPVQARPKFHCLRQGPVPCAPTLP